MKKLILICACICILFACKKSSSSNSSSSIQAKWLVDNLVQNNHINNQDNITTLTGNGTDYVDFRSDGKVISSFQGSNDTSYYSLSGNNKVIINTDTLNIVTLTSSTLKLYEKLVTSNSSYTEFTYNLKK